jgi:hypothetical protein
MALPFGGSRLQKRAAINELSACWHPWRPNFILEVIAKQVP